LLTNTCRSLIINILSHRSFSTTFELRSSFSQTNYTLFIYLSSYLFIYIHVVVDLIVMFIVWQCHSRLNLSLILIIQRIIDRIFSAHLKSSADDWTNLLWCRATDRLDTTMTSWIQMMQVQRNITMLIRINFFMQ